ncbi:type IV pilus assembly protein PilM [candidate division KSB1 bacterium]|nr:type IV pilus assembly protein PilM [candidate division KSB1 bacterium]
MTRRTKVGIGIDVGSSGVQLAVLRTGKTGIAVDCVDSRSLPHDAVVEGTVMDSQLVCDKISELLQEHKLRGKPVALSVAGRRVMIKRISTEEMSDEELKSAILFEAKSNLPFDLSEVSLDFAKLGQDSESGRMDVLLVAAKNDRVFDAVEPIAWAGARPTILEAEPFALQAALSEAGYLDENLVVAAIQIGFQSTDVTTFDHAQFESTRSFNIGGKSYVEGLMREQGIPFDKATALLGKSQHSEEEREAVLAVARRVAEKIAEQIERGLPSHFGAIADHPVDRVVLCGGGAHLPLLEASLRTRLGCEVETANPFRNLELKSGSAGDAPPENAPQYTAAIGLALRALTDDHFGFNLLLPQDRPGARTASYAGAGTIVPIVGISAVILGMAIAHIAQENQLTDLNRQLAEVKSEADVYRDKIALVEDLTAKRADVSARIDVISDLDKNRFARIKLLQLVNDALPELTWITSLAEVQTPRGPGMNVAGVTSSNLKVSQLMSNLLKVEGVRGVDLLVSEQGMIADVAVTNFTLQCGYPGLGLSPKTQPKPENLLAKGAAALKAKRKAEDELKKETSK